MREGTHRQTGRENDGGARAAWAAQLEAELRADPAALFELGRRVTGYLVQWRAYDFRAEWPDLVQEVLLALLVALRRGSIEDPAALFAYLRGVTRHKLTDRLRTLARPEGRRTVPWDEVVQQDLECFVPPLEVTLEVRLALEKLPEAHRSVIFGVYGEGKSYQRVADETGIPLGSVKRYLRQGLAQLRDLLADLEPGDRSPAIADRRELAPAAG